MPKSPHLNLQVRAKQRQRYRNFTSIRNQAAHGRHGGRPHNRARLLAPPPERTEHLKTGARARFFCRECGVARRDLVDLFIDISESLD